MKRLALSITMLALLFIPAVAQGAVGDRLDLFTPDPSGNGRGIENMGRSSTAYYSTVSSEDKIYMVDLKTHAAAGQLDTNLEGLEVGRSYGALAWDAGNGRLLGARYKSTAGVIDAIDPNSGGVSQLFNARDVDLSITGVDGLSVDTDGTLWISADGLGLGTTTIFHFSSAGAVLGSFVVGFGNSGIAVDGDYLWLVDVNSAQIHQYTKAGAATGVSFATTGLGEPEDITIDECSFSGKKAIWAYTAAFSGSSMAAYEIGSSSNAGCPAGGGGGNPSLTDPGAPSKIKIGKPPKGGYRAGVPIWFDLTSTLDPNGIIFIYIWYWRDYVKISENKPSRKPTLRAPSQEKGKVKHKFKCAGRYKGIKVKVLDAFANTKTITLKKTVSVKFPRKAWKRHGSLRVGPKVKKASKKRAKISLSVKKNRKRSGRGRRTKIRRIVYYLNGKRVAKRKRAKKAIKKKVRKGPNILKIKVSFRRPGGKKTIKTCFQVRP